ncbi:MAG: hypothetical protein ABIT38_01985, partial [Gemmatimonadaceae bacterium]
MIPFAIVLPAVVMLGATIATPLAAQGRSKASIQKSVDSVAASYLKDKKAAGMSIAVLRGADTLVMKGY